jgi:hypothetical protein
MKKTLIAAALMLGTLSAYPQGQVLYNDGQSDMTIHIFAPQTATPSVEITGDQAGALGVTADIYDNNTTDGNYAGTSTAQSGTAPNFTTGGSVVYTGGAIGNTIAGGATAAGAYNYNNGTDFTVELYAAAGLNQALSALQPVTQYVTTIATSSTKGGEFKISEPAVDPGIPGTAAAGNTATIALFAWYNGGGTYTSYASALAAGVPTGISPLDNLGSLAAPAPEDYPVGLESFSLALPVPEPSTIALGVIGVSTLLFRRRK